MITIKHYLIICSLIIFYGTSYRQGGLTVSVSAGTDVTTEPGTDPGTESDNSRTAMNRSVNQPLNAGQGFWVKATGMASSLTMLTITQSVRKHSSQPFLKSIRNYLLRVQTTDNRIAAQTKRFSVSTIKPQTGFKNI